MAAGDERYLTGSRPPVAAWDAPSKVMAGATSQA
jgi:hypothetical protein